MLTLREPFGKPMVDFKYFLNFILSMPQFDIFSFSSQVTWTLFFFTLVFAFIDYLILPIVASTLKTRSIKSFFQTLDDTSASEDKLTVKGVFSLSQMLVTSLDLKQISFNDSGFSTFNLKVCLNDNQNKNSIVKLLNSKVILKQKVSSLLCLFK
jgi:hypothetical protein